MKQRLEGGRWFRPHAIDQGDEQYGTEREDEEKGHSRLVICREPVIGEGNVVANEDSQLIRHLEQTVPERRVVVPDRTGVIVHWSWVIELIPTPVVISATTATYC